MRLKSTKFEVLPENIFKNDKLKRDVPIKSLTDILKNIKDPFVACINASYGQGKTTFIELWQAYLESIGIHSMLFNAWENDYTENSLACIIAEIKSALDKKIKSTKAEDRLSIEKQFDKMVKLGAKVVKAALPAAVKITTSGVLKIDNFCEDIIGEFAEKSTETIIKEYSKNKDLFAEFKKALHKNISHLSKDYPFFIFVDELDRCRPDFAIEVLETIKHLFDVEGVIFILTLDEKHIEAVIKNTYGSEVDAFGYMRRFIDLSYSLPVADRADYCREMFQRFDLIPYFVEREKDIKIKDPESFKAIEASAIAVVQYFKLTLREIEKIFTKLAIVLQATPKDQCLYPYVLFLLLILHLKDNEIYKKIIRKEIKMSDIIKHLCQKLQIPEEELFNRKNSAFLNILIWLNMFMNANGGSDDYKKLYTDLTSQFSSNEDVKNILDWMCRYSEQLQFDWSISSGLKLLDERIDFMSKINT